MLKITDLHVNKEMDSTEMTGVRGGFNPFATFDSSSTVDNKVAEAHQGFGFALGQQNLGQLVNNQTIYGGNGTIDAKVNQDQYQTNYLDVSDIGNIFVS
jgi:hypothetical protein